MSRVLALILFFAAFKLNAQNFNWAKQTGSPAYDRGLVVTTDNTGNVYVAGDFDDTLDLDPGPGVLIAAPHGTFVQKFDPVGNLTWGKYFRSETLNRPYGIKVSNDGSVYILGTFANTTDFDPGPGIVNLTASNFDAYLVKLSSAGSFLFARQYGGPNDDFGYNLDIDVSGNVFITGTFGGTFDADPSTGTFTLNGIGSSDIFILKLTTFGYLTWAKAVGGKAFDTSNDIVADHLGNIYVTGYIMDTADLDPGVGVSNVISIGAQDIFVLKLNSSGNYAWGKNFGSTYLDIGFGIAVDDANNVYTTGYYCLTADFDPGPGSYDITAVGAYDVFLQKLSPSGTFVWARSFGGSNYDYGYCIDVDASNNVYVGGQFYYDVDFDPSSDTSVLTSFGARDAFVSKFDNLGNFQWAKQIGGNGEDVAFGISATNDKVISTGQFSLTCDFDPGAGVYDLSSFGNTDAFVHQMSNGALVSANEISQVDFHFVNVFPNPCSKNLTISWNSMATSPIIAIYSMQGELVYSQQFHQTSAVINTGPFANGIYTISFQSGQKLINKKLMVQHE